MLIEEEEAKTTTEINPDALEAVFEDDSAAAEEEAFLFRAVEEEEEEVDIAFEANPEGYW
jgi:hypothetical protein